MRSYRGECCFSWMGDNPRRIIYIQEKFALQCLEELRQGLGQPLAPISKRVKFIRFMLQKS